MIRDVGARLALDVIKEERQAKAPKPSNTWPTKSEHIDRDLWIKILTETTLETIKDVVFEVYTNPRFLAPSKTPAYEKDPILLEMDETILV
jgi:hypothetical protein